MKKVFVQFGFFGVLVSLMLALSSCVDVEIGSDVDELNSFPGSSIVENVLQSTEATVHGGDRVELTAVTTQTIFFGNIFIPVGSHTFAIIDHNDDDRQVGTLSFRDNTAVMTLDINALDGAYHRDEDDRLPGGMAFMPHCANSNLFNDVIMFSIKDLGGDTNVNEEFLSSRVYILRDASNGKLTGMGHALSIGENETLGLDSIEDGVRELDTGEYLCVKSYISNGNPSGVFTFFSGFDPIDIPETAPVEEESQTEAVTEDKKELAITFDDAPLGNGRIYTGEERTQRLVEILDNHGVQTVFFANTTRLNSANGRERLVSYSNAGHILANHTHSHHDISNVSVDEYIENILLAERSLSQFPTFKKWFRFPYLAEGKSLDVRDDMRLFLDENDYINGYVTINNYDWYINSLVQQALRRGKNVHFDRVCTLLTDVILDSVQYYDDVAKRHIGNVRHVLLLHENDVQALCLDRLITSLTEDGWDIIPPERAFSDPLLASEPDTLYLHQGRVAAMAHIKTGENFISQWESTRMLSDEFERRVIADQ